MNQEVEEMAEETFLENEEQVVVNQEAEEVEYSEVEQEAMEQGWNPEGVEGKINLTAEEFLNRKPLYDEIHKLKKKVSNQQKQFDALQKHEKMVRDRMHEDHVKELKTAKRTALEEMDYDKADEIDDEIYKARKEHEEAVSGETEVNTQEEIQEILEEWAEKNPWYTNSKAMKRFADGEGQDFRMENPNASFDELLAHITKEVKKEFPEKFQNMKRNKSASVEEAGSRGAGRTTTTKQKTIRDLPEEAIPVMKTLVRAGAFPSEQDYVNDYFNQ